MPFYNWCCSCGAAEQTFEHKPEPRSPMHCDAPMERDWHGEARRHTPGSTYPYITTNITGKPIEVTSATHLDQLCREHGVTHRPDAAWIEKRYEGLDYRTGKQIYREGSGAGMPGSWI